MRTGTWAPRRGDFHSLALFSPDSRLTSANRDRRTARLRAVSGYRCGALWRRSSARNFARSEHSGIIEFTLMAATSMARVGSDSTVTGRPAVVTTTPVSMTLVDGVRSFLIWLGTALAGVSAILYACGYLIVRSQMSMLGVRELVEFGNERFLHEGATFVLSIAYTLLRPVLSIVVVLSVATLLIGLLWRVALRLDRGSRLSRAVDRMAAFVRRPAARRAAYAVALLALLLHASRYFNDYERPLAVVNMLFQPQKQPGELEALILAGNSTALHQRFQGLLWGAALAAMLTFVGWRVVSPLKLRGWLLLPFAVTSCLYLITLPMAYGVMQRPIEYARVSLAVEELGATMVGSLFLLERRSDGFVVWNRDVREVSWIPASKVRRVDVRAVEPLFTAPSGELK